MDASTEVLIAIRHLEAALDQWDARLPSSSAAQEDALAMHLRTEVDMMRSELARLRREFAVQLANHLRT
jgi:hypothetical protein